MPLTKEEQLLGGLPLDITLKQTNIALTKRGTAVWGHPFRLTENFQEAPLRFQEAPGAPLSEPVLGLTLVLCSLPLGPSPAPKNVHGRPRPKNCNFFIYALVGPPETKFPRVSGAYFKIQPLVVQGPRTIAKNIVFPLFGHVKTSQKNIILAAARAETHASNDGFACRGSENLARKTVFSTPDALKSSQKTRCSLPGMQKTL